MLGFPDGSEVKKKKKSTCNAGDSRAVGSTPESGRLPGGGNRNLLQYSYLKNPMDRGAWRAPVHGGHKGSDTTVATEHGLNFE